MRGNKPQTGRESVRGWPLLPNIGVLDRCFFARHVIRGGRISEGGDRLAEDRLRSKVAVAHLALGVLGLLSVRFRGMFWFATIVGQAVSLGGVTVLYACEISKNKLLLFDILMLLAHVILLKAYDPLETTQPPCRWRRSGARL